MIHAQKHHTDQPNQELLMPSVSQKHLQDHQQKQQLILKTKKETGIAMKTVTDIPGEKSLSGTGHFRTNPAGLVPRGECCGVGCGGRPTVTTESELVSVEPTAACTYTHKYSCAELAFPPPLCFAPYNYELLLVPFFPSWDAVTALKPTSQNCIYL